MCLFSNHVLKPFHSWDILFITKLPSPRGKPGTHVLSLPYRWGVPTDLSSENWVLLEDFHLGKRQSRKQGLNPTFW